LGNCLYSNCEDHANGIEKGRFVPWFKPLLTDLRGLFRREQTDDEVAEELHFHIEMRERENIAAGMTPDEAREDARRRFGNFEQLKQTCREIRGAGFLETFVQDVRFGSRTLLKNRGMAAAAILALALGIGASTCIFSVVNAVLLRPLPYKDPDRLVWITQDLPRFNAQLVTGADFLEWRERDAVFGSVAAFQARNFNLTGSDTPERVSAGAVSADFMSLLGVQPALGRIFLPEEDRPGGDNVVMLSRELWERRFGGEKGVIGQQVTLDGKRYAVIGITPSRFRIFGNYDVWVPLALDPVSENQRYKMSLLYVIARLKPHVTLEQARAEVTTIAQQLEHRYPQGYKGVAVKMIPLQEKFVSDVRLSLLTLLAAVGFVLLVACSNVANLLLAHGSAREREIAVRGALGASRLRLARQLMTESIVLGLLGGVAGLLLGIWGTRFAILLIPVGIPGGNEIRIDEHVLWFALVVSFVTAVIFGFIPAVSTTRNLDLSFFMKESGDSSGTRSNVVRFRSALTVCQLGLTLVLLTGAGLMARSLLRLRDVKMGFRPENVLTAGIELPQTKYRDSVRQAEFFREVLTRVQSLRGVESAGTTSQLPMSPGPPDQGMFSIEGERPWPPEEGAQRIVLETVVSPDYFRTMGIPLIEGQMFSAKDMQDDLQRILINQSLAKRFFPGISPVGKRLKLGFPEAPLPWLSIAGVVGDVRQQSLEDDPGPAIYLPYAHSEYMSSGRLVIHTTVEPESLAAAVRFEVYSVDPSEPVYDVKTMQEHLDASIAPRRFKTALLGIFGSIALVLAAVGIYGVMSYSVSQRVREIGIRMALGANCDAVVKMIVLEASKLIAVGIVVGVLGAICVTRFLTGLLYRVPSTDPATFVLVSLFLSSVSLLASYIPARKAAMVDPLVALRHV
jgi:putative ABC transport system permease protein